MPYSALVFGRAIHALPTGIPDDDLRQCDHFFLFADTKWGIQTAALVLYTSAIIIYTFSANRGMPRYLFRCPIVREELPRLARRHVAFSIVLVGLLTAALLLRQYSSPWWLTASGAPKSISPFTYALFILSACLALTQVLTNRSALRRAHERADADRLQSERPTISGVQGV